MTDSASKLMAKKRDYQLKWILANKNEYQDKFVLAAIEEIAKRERSIYFKIRQLLNSLFHSGG